MKINFVWLLWSWEREGDPDEIITRPYVEAVFTDKVLAEADLRALKDTDPDNKHNFWIQEKAVTHD
jgi:hypothetical protein